MKREDIEIAVSGGGRTCRLEVYRLELTEEFSVRERPMIVICPGGRYEYTAEREAGPIALLFNSLGFHAAVLRYSCAPAEFPAALEELAVCVAYLREKAGEWRIVREKIAVCGFSAGGHLAACLGAFWNAGWLAGRIGRTSEEIRPDRLILGYPVITAGEYGHLKSFENILGQESQNPDKRLLVSIERQVGRGFPPSFIWHTFTDAHVPVQNSLLLVSAMAEAGVPAEFHLFQDGPHGLALGDWRTRYFVQNENSAGAAAWPALVRVWLEGWMRE